MSKQGAVLGKTTRRYLISGKVQGVGYRRFAQKRAQSLGLSGWTRNLLDGRVEVWAQGAAAELEKFCEQLREGPPFSVVEDVRVDDMKSLELIDFEVRADGDPV